MANYRDELEQMRFTPGEKAELTRRLTAGRAETRPRRMRMPYRGLVAAVAAVSLLLGAAGAVSLAGVSPTFREMFGITDDAQAQQLGAERLDLTFKDQNGSGASIAIREVVKDQEKVYVLMDFTVPAGVELPTPEETADGRNFWLGEEYGECSAAFYGDEACVQRVNPRSWGWVFQAVDDPDPADQVIPLMLQIISDEALPEEAAWLRVTHLSNLWALKDGKEYSVLSGMDFTLTVPIETTAEIYSFEGRCGVNLNGVTLAAAENLTISPISVAMDLVIPDGEAYDAAFDQSGPWQMYVLLEDGTMVQTRFEKGGGVQDVFHDEAGQTFFRADHVRFELESPIDVGQIKDLVFVGDNSLLYGEEEPDGMTHFRFSPHYFRNETYWNEVSDLLETGLRSFHAGGPEISGPPFLH